ncbi:MAG: glycosyl transferase family 1 [Desulfobacterales bacterium]|nr:MAG: glycosyl transferase family 1 [Desulfobacterales bacterium]
MKILYLEPFYGGSHKDMADGFAAHSSHEVQILRLPPRFWKWRMRGAALAFFQQIDDISSYDLIFATDMMDLTDFKSLVGPACPSILLYFHENQLTYPLAPEEKRDYHLGFTNIISAWVADRVVFNSTFHKYAFLDAANQLIRKMPDARPSGVIKAVEEKSSVLYPGCSVPAQATGIGGHDMDPPLVVWNHRWEYDKNPDDFFQVLTKIKAKHIRFSLAILGEQYDTVPPVFEKAKAEFRSELKVFGYQKSKQAYLNWLSRGTVTISTAVQENFGISTMEAIAHGCFPLLPNRLSYPELVPESFRKEVIYASYGDLEHRLARILANPASVLSARKALAENAVRFSWDNMIPEYDTIIDCTVRDLQDSKALRD